MFTLVEVEKLGALHAVQPSVLSLYLTVVPHPVELCTLPARVNELIAAAEGAIGGPWRVQEEDRGTVLGKLAAGSEDWLGRTVAIFACADVGLLQAFALPCQLPDRAVFGIRPHIRPLLVALQRCPAYRVAVADPKRTRMLSMAGDDTKMMSIPPEQALRCGERQPLVIGGYDDDVRRLLADLPPAAREDFAGSFAADPWTLTPARARDLAAPVIARWSGQRARCLADQIRAIPPCGLAAVGLPACLAALNASAVDTLIVPEDGLVPGYECGRCGALCTDAAGCPDWGTAPLPVPDVIEEMVTRTLEDGGRISVVPDDPSPMAAKLHFPLT
jgi:hypothetical protein